MDKVNWLLQTKTEKKKSHKKSLKTKDKNKLHPKTGYLKVEIKKVTI